MGKNLSLTQLRFLKTAARFARDAQVTCGDEVLKLRRAGASYKEISIAMKFPESSGLRLDRSLAIPSFMLLGSNRDGESYDGLMDPAESALYKGESLRRSGNCAAKARGESLWSSGEKLCAYLCSKAKYSGKEIGEVLKSAHRTNRTPGAIKHSVYMYKKDYKDFRTVLKRAGKSS